METLLGKALGDLANLVEYKWYSGMGLIGLVLFTFVLINGSVHDDLLIGYIAVALMGFGFGEAESRTFQKIISAGYMITKPARQFSLVAFILYTIGLVSLCLAVYRGYFVLAQ